MSNYQFDLLVFICRAQPPHFGHLHVIMQAMTQARRVLVLLGSANSSRSLRNPFTYDERLELFSAGLSSYTRNWFGNKWREVGFHPLDDYTYNDTQWVANVQKVVSAYAQEGECVGLIGFGKDNSSYYLRKFPFWKSVGVSGQILEGTEDVMSSTDIRNALFDPNQLHGWNYVGKFMPESELQVLQRLEKESYDYFRDRGTWDIMKEETAHVRDYQQGFVGTKYPVKFVTVDSVVIQAGHVLMVERGGLPGKGLLALPGGFLDEGTLKENSLRELIEETGLKVPLKVLRGSNVAHREFDDPYRSVRGRTVTHTYLYKLDDEYPMPPVKGGSDAKRAFWQPIGNLNSTHCYEDHYHQIRTMIGMLPE